MYGPGPVEEYGAPYADFEIKGKVTDTGENVIKDIRVTVKPYEDAEYDMGTAATDADGGYVIEKSYWYGTEKLIVTAEDTDGPENGGEFQSQTKEEKITAEDYKGGSGWYDGKVTKTVDFTLEPKQEQTENESE